MPYERVTIKDIAERAGVSTGTVDRVIHERPNVSKRALERVKAVLATLHYEPNMYASALANSRRYDFYCLMPRHESEAYWEEVEQGQQRCCRTRQDFHVYVDVRYYTPGDSDSFTAEAQTILEADPDGVVVVPADLDTTRAFTDQLHEKQVPFIMLDSYMPDLKPTAFFGQDSFASGYFAARMLMLLAQNEKEIAIVKQTSGEQHVVSKQQANREVGFRHYMADHFPNVELNVIDIPVYFSTKRQNDILERYFTQHPDTHHCITFNSKAHIVGNFLLRTNRRNVQIMGYDMVEKNAHCVREGAISFLIAQHGYQQGYSSIDALVRAKILKKDVPPVNYMPIEILAKENVDYYRRTQI